MHRLENIESKYLADNQNIKILEYIRIYLRISEYIASWGAKSFLGEVTYFKKGGKEPEK